MLLTRDPSIAKLKAEAAQHYRRFVNIAGGYDCGKELLKTLNPEAQVAATGYNAAMDKLSKIDPNFPISKRFYL